VQPGHGIVGFMKILPAGAFRVAKWARIVLAGCVFAALGACGAKDPPARQAAAVSQSRQRPAPAPAALPVAIPGSNHAALWRLRAGLNVAALTCRTRTPVAPAYGRMLSRHRTLLADAYRAEQRRLGISGLDREQTRTYNRFSNQRSPAQFCRSAADIAKQAAAMPSANLAPVARSLAGRLESYLR
jgi:hypothetical protein